MTMKHMNFKFNKLLNYNYYIITINNIMMDFDININFKYYIYIYISKRNIVFLFPIKACPILIAAISNSYLSLRYIYFNELI